MNEFLVRDLNKFKVLYQQYLDNNLAPTEDYIHEIVSFKVKIIPQPSGGCWDREYIKTIIPGVKRKQPFSTNNNCFFKCLQQISPEFKPTLTLCNSIRKSYNLPPNSPIPFSVALHIIQSHNLRVSLYCEETKEFFNNQDLLTIVLYKSHYSLDIYYPKQKCTSCDKEYYEEHTCENTCNNCGKTYKKTHNCNNNRVGYYQAKIKKNGRYLIRSTKKCKELHNNVIHYDIESYVSGTGTHVPYILGFVEGDGDFNYFAGDNCIDDFVRYLLNSKLDNLVVNAFNGANFDHYFLVKSMNRLNIIPDEIIINNGSIIRLTTGRVKTFDLMRHITGSLSQALKDFGCQTQKGEFDHNKACRWEDMSGSLREECLKYLTSDVLGLRELFNLLREQCFKDYNRDITKFISTSSLGFDIWKDHIPLNKLVDLSDSTEVEQNIRKSIYGGRCYKSKTEFTSLQYESKNYEEVTDYLLNVDVVSLYPTSMLEEFSVGKRHKTSEFIEDVLGIYKVKYITNKKLLHPPVARKDENGFTKWDLKNSTGWYTSIDIKQMIKYGYEVEVLEGYYWDSTAAVFSDYINKFFDMKKTSTKGSVQYTLAKLLMNGLYGKMIQRPIFNKTETLNDVNHFWEFRRDHVITDLDLIGTTWYISGHLRSEIDSVHKISKPSHYGAFVLAYSHKIMYDHMMQLNPENKHELDFYYTDTDSLHITGDQAKLIPNYDGKNLGDLANDYPKKAKIIRAIYIAPKLYMTIFIDTDNVKTRKIKGKGLNKKKLTEQDFEAMLKGEVVKNTKDFTMKRINLHKTSKEQHLDNFSIQHIKNFERSANKTPYSGRTFLDKNRSIPLC